MKNATLIFRSLAIIIFTAGVAHLVSYISPKEDLKYGYEESIDSYENQKDYKDKGLKKRINYNPKTDYLVGNWRVSYYSEDFKGAVVYNIRKEGKRFNAYSYQYEDENGYTEHTKGSKALTIKSFDGYKGTGVYSVEYKQQEYQVECQIDMVDENTFKLSYDYYGYSDEETWKRQSL